jgi:Xaa-Pro aminopeptidase
MGETFVPKKEIYSRLNKLQEEIGKKKLNGALVFEYMDIFYYTGTIQNGVLFIPAVGEPVFFIRRSVERAEIESPLNDLIAFKSFKEFLPHLIKRRGYSLSKVGIDETSLTLFMYKLLSRHLNETEFSDISLMLKKLRAVKSEYEIDKIRKAGDISRQICLKIPDMLIPGVSEWELNLKLFKEIADLGNNCMGRLSFNSGEFLIGNICFGESAIYPSAFDGPGGIIGKSPACPYAGSDKQLKKGDVVYIDISYPFDEYFIDKTRIFSIGRPDSKVLEMHSICLNIQAAVKRRLLPRAIPSDIFEEVYNEVVIPNNFQKNFMGYKANQVQFLGHGIGLVINEYPIIAGKCDDPLEKNMVIAVEPKKGIKGVGMVGIENTFLVTENSAENLTKDSDEIIVL